MQTKTPSTVGQHPTLPIEEADQLALEHRGWAESIARSVARGWNLDWQLDGLDGAAMEALLFCARRFQPSRGVPFRGYARKRIHEASTEAARKSRGWRSGSRAEVQTREISAELLNVYPDLRTGQLPLSDESSGNDEADTRMAVRQLLIGATLIAARQGLATATPEEALDYKKMIEVVADMDPVHQSLIWKIYWEGCSLRNVADEWETDELNVIREHKVLLEHLLESLSKGKRRTAVKVRPGLKQVAIKLRKKSEQGEFRRLLRSG
ncbi:MAG: hypothetical protein K1X83_05460 [Oligoflexia bacterium]|nr:hypothetical protein [Oligoflexia bacterium]